MQCSCNGRNFYYFLICLALQQRRQQDTAGKREKEPLITSLYGFLSKTKAEKCQLLAITSRFSSVLHFHGFQVSRNASHYPPVPAFTVCVILTLPHNTLLFLLWHHETVQLNLLSLSVGGRFQKKLS